MLSSHTYPTQFMKFPISDWFRYDESHQAALLQRHTRISVNSDNRSSEDEAIQERPSWGSIFVAIKFWMMSAIVEYLIHWWSQSGRFRYRVTFLVRNWEKCRHSRLRTEYIQPTEFFTLNSNLSSTNGYGPSNSRYQSLNSMIIHQRRDDS